MYRFGEYSVDVDARELRRGDKLVHIEPQAFDLLALLLEQRQRVVSQRELLDGVWGHSFLSDANLTTRVKEVRRALGDDGRAQHTVRNIRGRGYRFIAEVTVVDVSERAPQPAARPTGAVAGLIGRDMELARIVDLLRSSPLVTIVGPGGVGKSRLAVAASAVAGRVTHLVELAGIDDPADLLAAVARRCGILLDSSRPVDALRSLARLDAVLVLDNCEHVLDEVSDLVEGVVVDPGRTVTILATSRERLGVRDESVVRVGPLSTDRAVELFSTRASEATGGHSPSAMAAARIVDALDRLPLALEMAAARLGAMTVDDLEKVIVSGPSLLAMTHRSPVRRHRSLESLVDWSYSSLDDGLRDMLVNFSVFAGWVTAGDAAAVLAPHAPAEVALGLAALVDRSLLVVDTSGPTARYSMLWTVKAVVVHRLATVGGAGDIRRRHAEHILAAIGEIDRQLRTEHEAAARSRLEGTMSELRQAQHWMAEQAPELADALYEGLFHVANSGLWHEPADWARRLLARRGGERGMVGAQFLVAAALAHRGQQNEAFDLIMAVDPAVLTSRQQAIRAEILGDICLYRSHQAGALDAALQLQQLGREVGDLHVAAFGVVDAALAHCYAGDPALALSFVEDGPADGIAPSDAAWFHYARGEALSAAGKRGATAAFVASISLGQSVGAHFVVSVAQTSLAIHHARSGRTELALATFDAALEGFLRRGNLTHSVTALNSLVDVLAGLGDHAGAVSLAAALARDALGQPDDESVYASSAVVHRAQVMHPPDVVAGWWHAGVNLDLGDAVRFARQCIARAEGIT